MTAKLKNVEVKALLKNEEFNKMDWPRVGIFKVKVIYTWTKGLKVHFSSFSMIIFDRDMNFWSLVKLKKKIRKLILGFFFLENNLFLLFSERPCNCDYFFNFFSTIIFDQDMIFWSFIKLKEKIELLFWIFLGKNFLFFPEIPCNCD